MRFHMGVSFRLKTIKKFLFPILIGILAYFGFGFFSFIHVNALTNYDTSYTIEPFDWDTYLSNVNCGGENLKDVVDDFIENYDNTYWQRHMNILDQINTERSLAIQASSLNSKNQTVISEQDKAYAQMILANNMLLDFQKTSGTYSDAVNVMKKYGLFEYASAPMTKNEWIRHGNKAADYNSYIESYMVNLSQKVEISIQ